MPTLCPSYTRHGHSSYLNVQHSAGDGHSVWITAVGTREPRLREVSSPDWTAIRGQNTELEPWFQFLASEFLGSSLGGYSRVRDVIQHHMS